MRIVALFVLIPLVAATTCSTGTVIAVAPAVSTAKNNATDSAIALVARVVARHGFEPYSRGDNDEGWSDCVVEENVWLCRRADERDVQFLLYQTRTTRFALWADSVRREVLDSLRARFGEQRVQECKTRDECNDRAD